MCATCKTFQLFKICDAEISLDLADLTQYVRLAYFKQLEGFVHGTHSIAYSIYLNTYATQTYSYHVFYLNRPSKLKIFDLLYCSSLILPQTLSM